MIKYTYLLIDLLTISMPLIFSFHPRIRLYRHWSALLPAIASTALIYTAWDSWFTQKAIWGFNPKYIVGVYLGNLPLEEVLFFICIPYACVFTYECLAGTITADFVKQNNRLISIALTILLLLTAIVFRMKPYTASAFCVLAFMILVCTLLRTNWLPKFYATYGVLLVPFLIVNGLLTGTALSAPVVWYNPAGIIGVRILTIPFEDIFYGMGLILANVWLYTKIQSYRSRHSRVPNTEQL
jgi:lycopene cyclase domain-containing protein